MHCPHHEVTSHRQVSDWRQEEARSTVLLDLIANFPLQLQRAMLRQLLLRLRSFSMGQNLPNQHVHRHLHQLNPVASPVCSTHDIHRLLLNHPPACKSFNVPLNQSHPSLIRPVLLTSMLLCHRHYSPRQQLLPLLQCPQRSPPRPFLSLSNHHCHLHPYPHPHSHPHPHRRRHHQSMFMACLLPTFSA